MDHRRLGKVWKYTEPTLRDTLERCVEHYGHIPQAAEFDWWREREVQLSRAQGRLDARVPLAT